MDEAPCLCGLFLTVALPSVVRSKSLGQSQEILTSVFSILLARSFNSFRPCCNSVAHVLRVWVIPSWHYTAGLASGAVRSYPEVLLELHWGRKTERERPNCLIAPFEKYFCSGWRFFTFGRAVYGNKAEKIRRPSNDFTAWHTTSHTLDQWMAMLFLLGSVDDI